MGVLSVEYDIGEDEFTKSDNIPVSGKYMFYATGDFKGGCLSLEASPDLGVTWFTVDQLTEAGRLIRYLVNGEKIRIKMEGSTLPIVKAGIRQ